MILIYTFKRVQSSLPHSLFLFAAKSADATGGNPWRQLTTTHFLRVRNG